MIKKLAIIGVGLIGGSLALALKKAGYVEHVSAFSRREETRRQALELGIADSVGLNLAETVKDASIVLLAVPMGAMESTFDELAPHITNDMIVTDAGSAKQQLVTMAKSAFKDRFKQYVPGHPIAGTEKSGPSAAFADLYQNHRVVLTPTDATCANAVETVRKMWQVVGAEVLEMEAQHHDVVLAATSHLPHLLAFNLVGMLAKGSDVEEVLRYAAGGFRDFSRIASSDPVMWRDICLSNSEAILELLTQYQHDLSQLEKAIREQDAYYLQSVFEQAKSARDNRFNEPGLVDNSEV